MPRLLATVPVILLIVALAPGADEDSNPLTAAHCCTQGLTLYPRVGKAIETQLPNHSVAWSSSDGRSVFGVDRTSVKRGERPPMPGLLKLDFNPMRMATVPGSSSFVVDEFTVSSRGDRVLLVGSDLSGNSTRCGVFELALPAGSVKQVLAEDCDIRYPRQGLSLSPDGMQALSTFGHEVDRSTGMELMDLVRGTSKMLGKDLWLGTWSPDGKWIAAFTREKHVRLVILDGKDFSRRRDLGHVDTTRPKQPVWSPDSHYLLLWKRPWYYGVFCSFSLDVDPPWALESVDIATGKRREIPSSHCTVSESGRAFWISSAIGH